MIACLSGHVSAGKTTVGQALIEVAPDSVLVSSREILLKADMADRVASRRDLQALGDNLDQRTQGTWLSAGVRSVASGRRVVVVDAVRTRDQIDALRALTRSLMHVHLHAPLDVLTERYEMRLRQGAMIELPSYDDVLANPTERDVDDLLNISNLSFDTSYWSASEVVDVVERGLVAVVARLGASAG